ncbi:EAL domain-containing protein [Salinicola sp. RZ23]|uniref:bifunctional diguanylate cyclase/phosphodiesterase n=1 Tax=Salinicola sp. RZ23 TaxID=1949087 RepID=UPI000DA12754|nr:EAL domain-containing protein [Salinicola sp. RZ23]
MSKNEKPYRLSLKWKAFALTSLVLVSLALLISWISYRSLMSQFDENQLANQERQRHQISVALRSSASELKQLAAIVAASEALKVSLSQEGSVPVSEALDSQWPTLQLDAGVDELVIYDTQGEHLATYGGLYSEAPEVPPEKSWLMNIIASESPDDRLICKMTCRQYVAVPILVEGDNAGVLLLSRSLVDVMGEFQRSSGDDLALLSEGKVNLEKTGLRADHRLLPWNSLVLAMTHYDETLPLLREASRHLSLPALVKRHRSIEFRRQQYMIGAVALNQAGSSGGGGGYFISFDNVTQQLAEIKASTRSVALASVTGWLWAEAFLLLILWRPTRRIRTLSLYLPGLAKGEFEDVRGRISRHYSGKARDEIDVLSDTAVELSFQLEALEMEVKSRGIELENQVDALERERDLVNNLMNSAQVLVVVHDGDDKILLANRYAAFMVGKVSDELMGQSFKSCFLPLGGEWGLSSLPGRSEESELLAPDGSSKAITWSHAPLVSWSSAPGAMVSVGVDITERKNAEIRLAWLAHRDPLTELYNRRYFEEALARAVTPHNSGAMLYLDLDRFKELNELGGHQAGDRLLVMISDLFRDQFSHIGLVARLGGDEFAVLLENASADRAVEVAEKIILNLDEISLDVDGQKYRAVASIGVACYPENGGSPKELMASADFAMYRAKEDALKRWHLLSSTADRESLQKRVYWEEQIRLSLENDGFELWRQPIRSVSGNEAEHYELLIRMISPDTGELVSPGLFIPVAERSGQILAIDRWVISNSLSMMRSIPNSSTRFALNISGQSLRDETLTAFLGQQLHDSGVAPERLIIEVTETAAVTDFSTARAILQDIRKMGCAIALDDFGVGFSSFYYLDQLPADYIKIDGSFIQDLPENRRSQMLVKGIAEIAKGFGKCTVAEFVDRQEVYDILKIYGIDYVQGYWVGRPEKAFPDS